MLNNRLSTIDSRRFDVFRISRGRLRELVTFKSRVSVEIGIRDMFRKASVKNSVHEEW